MSWLDLFKKKELELEPERHDWDMKFSRRSLMSYNSTYEALCVRAEVEGTTDKEINVEISLICTNPGSEPSGLFGPPELYDPGEGPTWEIETIELVLEQGKPLMVSPEQFGAMFPGADKIMEDAIEDAVENGDPNG